MPFDDEPLIPIARPTRPGRRPAAGAWLLLGGALLGGLMLGAAGLWLVTRLLDRGPQNQPVTNPQAVERPAEPKSAFDAEEQEAIRVFKESKDSVVNVDTVVLVRNRLDMRVQEQQAGTGSGFFWDADGRIVTNFHVVKEAVQSRLRLRVVLADKSAWSAGVVGTAPDFDLAVIQITDPEFPKGKSKPIKVGTSNDLEVGQRVYAIGNPYALSLTMTKGIVSALDRQIESQADRPITGAIQTDAPINPGNSGGPLLDKDGRLIGVNTAIATPSGGNVGIGFAIPVNTVNETVTELIRHGRVFQPDPGLSLVEQRVVRRAGFPTGVMVYQVDPRGPAAKAGLQGVGGDQQPGDLIVAVNGEPVQGNQDFIRRIKACKVGEAVRLTVERGDQRLDVEVVLRGS